MTGVGEATGVCAVTGETLPFCGHLLAEEQPEAVARAILAFSARVGGIAA